MNDRDHFAALLAGQARIEQKLDDALITVGDHKLRLDALDEKVGKINKKLAWFAGVGTAIIALVKMIPHGKN